MDIQGMDFLNTFYQSQMIIRFQQHDAVSDKITESFDLILSRHTMIHLYNADALRVIQNFKDSGSK